MGIARDNLAVVAAVLRYLLYKSMIHPGRHAAANKARVNRTLFAKHVSIWLLGQNIYFVETSLVLNWRKLGVRKAVASFIRSSSYPTLRSSLPSLLKRSHLGNPPRMDVDPLSTATGCGGS